MNIRPYQIEDKSQVIALWEQCGLVREWNNPSKDIERKLLVDPELFIVGHLDGMIVASAMGGYEGHRGWVNYLAVQPEQQGKGYAKRIMQDLEEKLIARGCPKLNLQIRTSNTEIIAFYESLGYKIDDVNESNDLINRFNGEGGVNRVFVGLGYQITDKLSAGVDVNYNFGNIQNGALELTYTPEGDLLQYQSEENNRSDLSGVNFNFGLAYKTMISDKLELSAAATYAPKSTLTSDNERAFFTVSVDPNSGQVIRVLQAEEADLESQNLARTDLTLPSRLSFGAGLGKPRSWFVGAEYTLQNTSEFSNPVFRNNNTSYENASEISVGGFYIPNYNAFSGYFKRVVYRAGFNFANTGLVIKDESIKEFGISFGLGLPVGNRSFFSNANFGFEFGQRGTTDKNLIQENFINFNLSLSLNSRWFSQRKYN